MDLRPLTPCLLVLAIACSDTQRTPLEPSDAGQLEPRSQLDARQARNEMRRNNEALPMAGMAAPAPQLEPDAGAAAEPQLEPDAGTAEPQPEPEPDAGSAAEPQLEPDAGTAEPQPEPEPDAGSAEPQPEPDAGQPCHEAAGAVCGTVYIRCALCDGSQWRDVYPMVSCEGLCVDPSCPASVDGWGAWNAAMGCFEVSP